MPTREAVRDKGALVESVFDELIEAIAENRETAYPSDMDTAKRVERGLEGAIDIYYSWEDGLPLPIGEYGRHTRSLSARAGRWVPRALDVIDRLIGSARRRRSRNDLSDRDAPPDF